tara:strand:+ start:392 stop:1192 length:801 start_codon:yes stop_codon:yes gene_type:complete
MKQLSRKEIAEIIINQKEWTDQEWTDATGISRQTFWRMRNNKIKGVESKTLELMASASGHEITWKDHTKNQGQLQSSQKQSLGGDMTIERAVIKNQLGQIDVLNTKIDYLNKQINRLKQVRIESGWNFRMTTVLNESIFDTFKVSTLKTIHKTGNIVKCRGHKKITSVPVTITGDVSMLGYTSQEIESLTAINLFLLYHKDSISEVVKIIKHLKQTEDLNVSSKGIRILKAKDNSYKSFETEYFYTKDNDSWDAKSYWTFLGNQTE